MKIYLMPQDLVKQISICQRAISSRTTMPILECIHFEAGSNGLTLTATDLELSIETFMPCNVEEEGDIVVPANIIGNIFRKLPAEKTCIEEKDNTLIIDCGKIHYSLQLASADEFPSLPINDDSDITTLSNDDLMSAIKETEFATSTDESKIALTGIFFERKETSVKLVSLDGYRLAVREVPLDPQEKSFTAQAIVPKRAFIELSRIIPEEGRTKIKIMNGHIYFECGGFCMYSRLIDKKYIQYEEIISKEFVSRMVLNRKDFQESLERASLLAREERANLIKLYITKDSISIKSNSEIGFVNEEIACSLEGEELRIAFNAKYLLDGIRALDCETIRLDMKGPQNPLIIYPGRDEEKYLYLVLPVRIAGE